MFEVIYKDKEKRVFRMKFDRINKKLFEASKKTHDEYIETKWNRLFDSGKERIQDLITSKMDDNEFIKCISYWMAARFGYSLQEVIKEGEVNGSK
jgi:hypothetical protein